MIHLTRVEHIRPNPWQPRLRENTEKVQQLVESLLENVDRLPKTRKGLLQVPLARVVDLDGVPLGSKNTHGELLKLAEQIEAGEAVAQLAFGHRRWSAFRDLNAGGEARKPDERFATMPLELAILADRQMAESAARENVEREDLTWYEQAHFINRLIKDFNLTQVETAQLFGFRSQGSVGNYLGALRLVEDFGDEGLEQLALDGYLPLKHVLHLAPLVRDYPDLAHTYLEEGRFFTGGGEVRPASAIKADVDEILDALREDEPDPGPDKPEPEDEGFEVVEQEIDGQRVWQAGRDLTPLMTSNTYEWYTPAHLIHRVKQVLGGIALDPCSTDEANQVVGARRFFTIEDDGLSKPWDAKTVFMNPPYGDQIGDWVERLVGEFSSGRVLHAITLLPARTDTRWFQLLNNFPHCYVNGRLNFWGPEDKGNHATFPSVIVALGCDLAIFNEAFGEVGRIVQRVEEVEPDQAAPSHAWLDDYRKRVENHQGVVDLVLAAVGKGGNVLVALEENARRLAEYLGSKAEEIKVEIDGRTDWIPGCKISRLHGPTWIAVKERFFFNLHIYNGPPELKMVADQQLTTIEWESNGEPEEEVDGSTLPAWMVEDMPPPNEDRTLDALGFVIFQLTLAVQRLQEELAEVEDSEDEAILEHVLRLVSTATNPVCEMLRPLVGAAALEDLRWRLIGIEGAEEHRKVISNFLWENKPKPIIEPKDTPPALQLEEPEDPGDAGIPEVVA